MSDKPKRETFEEYTNPKNNSWEESNKYSELIEWTFHANDPLIDWQEQRIKRLENDVLYHTQEHDNLSEEAEEDEQRIAELEKALEIISDGEIYVGGNYMPSNDAKRAKAALRGQQGENNGKEINKDETEKKK